MCCAHWFRRTALALVLFTFVACGTKDVPKPGANGDPVGQQKEVDLTNPDNGLESDLAAAVEVEREASVVDGEAVGLPNQSRDFASQTSNLGNLTSTLADPASPFSGRSGATYHRLLRSGGGNSIDHRFQFPKAKNAPEDQVRFNLEVFDSAENAGRADGTGPVDGDRISTENYQPIFDNPYKSVKLDPLSTISSAVDTASYSNVRARFNAGQLPAKDAVRIADMLNYFNYDYAGPKNGDPVAFSLEIAPCPWQPKHQLLRVGLKAMTIDKENMPARNLTFLLDTSGSMNEPNRLPLVKESLKLLVQQLTEKDMVSIVTYAGNSGLALPPTPGSEKDKIMRCIDTFNAHGSTNGEGGLKAAYDQAQAGFIKDGVNRVILATDGDFNVGQSSDADMVRLIEEKRKTGVYLTVLGYGMGNLKDSKLEQLAHHGNGHYAYIDTLDEAKKVFVEQGGSLVTVAKDVKLQIEFNPAKVAGYRLIGYENRILRHEDFRNDKKDAGDMGSGHMCTVLYEIVPSGEKVENGEVEPLKYQTRTKLSEASKTGEWATVRMRYKDPSTEKAKEVEAPLTGDALGKKVSNDFEFAACVASFGMLLRNSEYKGNATYAATLESAEGLLRDKRDAHREEFAKLLRVALTLEQAKK